jgi:hypothetical protein
MKSAMTMTTMLLATMMTLSLGSAALAQQAQTGVVTTVDRINSTVAIRQTQGGTVGANPGPAEEYKAPGLPLDDLHAGDGVTFSATETGGVKTLTKLDRR